MAEKSEEARSNVKETDPVRIFTVGLLVILLVAALYQSYQIKTLQAEVNELKEAYREQQLRALQSEVADLKRTVTSLLILVGAAMHANCPAEGGSVHQQSISQSAAESYEDKVSWRNVLEEILPKGTPDYGEAAGVTYDDPEASLEVLAGFHRNISLSGEELERYLRIATTPGTACEYCCGVGKQGFGRKDGSLNCGCTHNVAFSGLTKWLIKYTDYSDEQIIQEIKKWKTLFFPREAVREELRKRGISPEEAGLPGMVGGC